jgi:Fe-S-cluster-containing hydrogenase component 2
MAHTATSIVEGLDDNTGFIVREDMCTGCRMCVLACSAIKEDVFSFSNDYSFIEIIHPKTPGTFAVRFTEGCDGCTYCLQFCGYEAIEKPEGWALAPRLKEIRRQQHARRREQRRAESDD